jgi:hypothetical protein
MLPDLNGYASVVVAFEPSGALGQVFARNVTAGAIAPIQATVGPSIVVEAALFKKPLEQLGLKEGNLIPGVITDPLLDLSSATVLHTAPGGTAWTVGPPSSLLSGLHLAGSPTSSCTQFRADPFDLPNKNNVRQAIQLGTDRWLLIQDPPSLLLLKPSTRTVTSPILTGALATATITSGYADADGDFYLGGWNGQIFHLTSVDDPMSGDLIDQFNGRTIRKIDGGVFSSTGAHEIFTLTDTGQLSRFDGTRSTQIAQLPDARDLLRPGPGEVYAVAQGMAEVLHFKLGRPPAYEQVASPAGGAFSLSRIGRFGVIVGTTRGQVLTSSNGVWSPALGPSPLTLDLNVIMEFQDGFLAAGTEAFVTQYTQGGFCTPSHLVAFDVWVLQPAGGAFLMLGDMPPEASSTPGAILQVVNAQ